MAACVRLMSLTRVWEFDQPLSSHSIRSKLHEEENIHLSVSADYIGQIGE